MAAKVWQRQHATKQNNTTMLTRISNHAHSHKYYCKII